MKHPSNKELQDYFENELNNSTSIKIRDHLEFCDRCSLVLAQMAKVDLLFTRPIQEEVPLQLQTAVSTEARKLLQLRRDHLIAKEQNKERRKEKIENQISRMITWKDEALLELRIPIFQAAALSLFLIMITKIGISQKTIHKNVIIDDQIHVIESELLGESNENI